MVRPSTNFPAVDTGGSGGDGTREEPLSVSRSPRSPISDAEQLVLGCPADRQFDAAGEMARGQIRRLLAGQDRLDNARREKGERQHPADAFRMHAGVAFGISILESAHILRQQPICLPLKTPAEVRRPFEPLPPPRLTR